ncbi:hypothetical protein E0H65_22550 [Rhizobium leguminosarum bv. viciae]|nr:hypothetical protein E0H65_22550 [Rhizobium leguminosarum bv. viciae]
MNTSRRQTKFRRRDVLVGATIAAATPSVVSASAGSMPLPLLSDMRSESTDAIKVAIDRSAWVSAKKRLVGSSGFDWLAFCSEDVLVDRIVFAATDKLLTIESPYDHFQIESLVSSVSSLLDRCLVYRREMYDLEEQAVRRALEYELFANQLKAQFDIETAPRIEAQRRLEKSGHEAASQEFKKDPMLALNFGFASISDASAKSSQEAVDAEIERKASVKIKWDALALYQSALQDRHRTPGHALNFRERYDRLRRFLEQDVGVAYQKLKKLSEGATRIFALTSNLERPFEFGYLDYLVSYTRQLSEALEIETIKEVDFEHVISLAFPQTLKANGSQIQRHFEPNAWIVALNPQTGSGNLKFSLIASEFPAFARRLRIRAIGLSLVLDSPEVPIVRFRSGSAVIFPPQVDQQRRPPIVIEKIGLYDPNSNTRLFTGTSANNLDPRGSWEVQVSTNMMWADAGAHGRSHANIRDIKFHLRLSATLDPEPISWAALSW